MTASRILRIWYGVGTLSIVLEIISTGLSVFRRVLPELVTLLVTLAIFSWCHRLISPTWAGTYRVGDDRTPTSFRDSFGFDRADVTVIVDGTITLPFLHPTTYRITPDNCLIELIINDKPVRESLPICDYKRGELFWLGEYLHVGSNSFRAVVRNDGGPGGLRFAVAPWEGLPLFLFALCSLIVAACLWNITRKLGIERDPLTLVWLFGLLVRFLYLVATPVSARAYDFSGHQEYIFYVLNNFAIPPPRGGWEFYQSPLYYFLVALILAPFAWCGFDERFLLNVAQAISFALSAAALAVGLWVGKMLWRKPKEVFFRIGFGITLAVFPGLVMFCSRVSNDAMVPLLAFLFLALLLRWYESGDIRFWDASICTLSLAILTKGSALAFVPIAVLSVVATVGRGINWHQCGRLIARACITLALLNGWYFVYRIGIQGQSDLISSIDRLDKTLAINVSTETFLSVDPLSVIQHPFNGSRLVGFGRERMWEFLPKSAFTGEWNFGGQVNSYLGLLHGMNYFVFMPLALIALTRDLLSRRLVPLSASLLMPLVSMVAAVVQYPFGVMQDFRFIPIITLPVTHYVLTGIALMPHNLSIVARWLLVIFWAICLFVLHGIAVS